MKGKCSKRTSISAKPPSASELNALREIGAFLRDSVLNVAELNWEAVDVRNAREKPNDMVQDDEREQEDPRWNSNLDSSLESYFFRSIRSQADRLSVPKNAQCFLQVLP